MATYPLDLKGKGVGWYGHLCSINGAEMATSASYLKWKGNGMATSRLSLKRNADRMATSAFYLRWKSNGMATYP